jgi:flagellar hook assembly protein FlgD
MVKSKYGAIISCTDAINNGTNIPTRAGCEETNGTSLGSEAPAETGNTADVTLGRAIPNPFTASMSYSYEVASGAEQPVEIGVYSIAGRLVRHLATGVQAAGRYTVKWDGRSDAGVQMAPGVYFLKARVGGDENTTRVLKIGQ